MRASWIGGLTLAALLTAAFVLAGRLLADPRAGAAPPDAADAALNSLLGGSRLFAGEICFDRADLYLHRGLEHLSRQGFHDRWFQRMYAFVSPRVLEHRESQAGLRDILPWVALAVRLAPTNTEYVLTQAYLLRRAGDGRRARTVLRAARAEMPDRPELPLDEARLEIGLGNADDAAPLLDRVIGLTQGSDAEGAADLLAEASMLRGLLREFSGRTDAAAVSPAHYDTLTNRVADLRAGRRPVPPAERLLANYRAAEEKRPLCHHDHDGDAPDGK